MVSLPAGSCVPATMIAVAEWNFITSIEFCAEAIPPTPNSTVQIVLKIFIVSLSFIAALRIPQRLQGERCAGDESLPKTLKLNVLNRKFAMAYCLTAPIEWDRRSYFVVCPLPQTDLKADS
jgi:hypothetical protein